jgi:hypothetical protein
MEPGQAETIIAMTRAAQDDQQAELAAHWLRVQQEAFRVFRTGEGEVCGYAACLSLHRARPEDLELDPLRRRCGNTLNATVLRVPVNRSWPGDSTLTLNPTSTIAACRGPCSRLGRSLTS